MPFGEEITPDGTHRTTNLKYNFGDNVRQKCTGYQKDEETQLDFAEARMYQNPHGRFTAVDPLLASGKSANPQTFNRYVYVMNNPLAYTDPSGLQATSTPYWTYRDDREQNGTPVRTFRRYTSQEQQKLYEDTRGGESFQQWTGQDFYLWNDGRGIYFGEGGSGAGLLFSTAIFSHETMSGLFATQNAGEQFNQEQLNGLKTAATEALNQLPEIQFAKATSALAGGLLAGGTTAGSNYFLRNVAFGTERSGAVFFSGPGTASYANQFALDTGRQTISMTPAGSVINSVTSSSVLGRPFYQAFPRTTERMWSFGSRHFAEGASGSVIFFGRTPNGVVWSTIERPILQQNQSVDIIFRRIPFSVPR